MADDPAAREVLELRERLRIEVERRVDAEERASAACSEAAAARTERDTARKRLQDSHPGVAKVLSQVQEQGATIAALRAALSESSRG